MAAAGTAAALAALVALAGCGGHPGADRAAFARRADAVCAPALRQLRGVERQLAATAAGSDPDAIYAASARLLRQGAAITRASADRLEALEPPGASRDAVRAWIAGTRRQAATTASLAAAFDRQDPTGIARLSEQADVLDERNDAAARRLGMRTCAERIRG